MLMRILICTTFWFLSLTSFSQFGKPVSFGVTGNFNFKTWGLADNDAGSGISADAYFFAKHKLQLLIETNADLFFGDKNFVIDPKGRENKVPFIYSIKAGPQLFVLKRVALSATYGPAWHCIQEVGFTTGYGIKYQVTGFFGENKRLVVKGFMLHIPKAYTDIRYFGLGIGCRFY